MILKGRDRDDIKICFNKIVINYPLETVILLYKVEYRTPRSTDPNIVIELSHISERDGVL